MALGGFGLVALWPTLGLLLDHPYDGYQLAVGFGSGLSAILLLLMSRQCVKVGEQGVRLVYPFKSRFVPWNEIVCFKVAEVRNVFGERLAKPAVLLVTGEAVPIPGADRVSLFQRDPYGATFPVLDRLEKERRHRWLDH